MTQADFKNQVNNLMDILFGAGVASHATIIEQINYLVFLRSLSRKDDNAMILDSAAEKVFSGELKKYHWDNLLILNAEELFINLEEVFRKLPEVSHDPTIKLLFRDAHVKVFAKPTLRRLVHEIEKMFSDLEKQSTSGHTDIFGDMYEYLLSKLSQAGTLGSFRTPRHIIKFIVDVIDPKKGETILDPACGTAGFLVAALKHLEEKYTSEEYKKLDKYPMNLLTPQERDFVYKYTFTGFDSDFDMFKFGLMNLYLHKLEHPNVKRQNTLVDTAGDRTKWDVILANPPFSGALDKNSVSEDIRMNTGATEVLFLRYMIDHLSINGRAGVVIPEGVLFNNGQAHHKIREMLLENGLWCVVSLHGDVFKPYAGVKTSILFFDKSLKDKNNNILMLKIKDDGFDHGGTKKPINKNDLPLSLEFINLFRDNSKIKPNNKIDFTIVEKSRILDNSDLNLQQDRYPEIKENFNGKYPLVELDKFCKFQKGKFSSTKTQPGIYPLVLTAKERKTANDFDVDGEAVLIPLISSSGHGKASINSIHYQSGKFAAANLLAVIIPDTKICNAQYLQLALDPIKNKIAKEKMSGAANVSMKIDQLHDIQIPMPPIEIQNQIIEKINNYQKIIDGAKQIIENWKPNFKIKNEYKKVKIGEISKLMTGGTPRTNRNEFYGGDIKWLVSGDIHKGEIYDCDGRITELALKESNVKLLPINSVLIALNGQGKTRGTVALLRTKATCNQSVVSIDPDRSKLLPEFLFYILQNKYQEIREITGDKQRSGLNMPIIRSIEIPLPSIEIQKQIIDEIEKEKAIINPLKKLIEIYQEKINQKIEEVWGK